MRRLNLVYREKILILRQYEANEITALEYNEPLELDPNKSTVVYPLQHLISQQ